MKLKTTLKKKRWWQDRNLMFYSILMAFPVIQFLVFYVGVNMNSILMAFQRIDVKNDAVTWTLSTIKTAFQSMTGSPELISVLVVSVISWLLLTVIGTSLGLFFSYYIYKKLPLSGAFRVILFLPSIMSAIVMATIFQFFVERAIPAIAMQFFDMKMMGLLENPETRFTSIMVYNILMGFGANVLMYTNSMSGVSQEMVEASELDGATTFQEFWYVTMPSIYPTLTMFMITGVALIFTNQLNLFSFYGVNAPGAVQTYGYYFYAKTQSAQSIAEYPILSAMGILMTVVAVPLTMFVKWAMEKHGPSED